MIAVFLGPTLPVAEARTLLEAAYLPPAAQGDIVRAVRGGARAIGLIDGYFHGVPSVWHKEILWAISQGVSVYGAASMGALRAAELAPYGMVGVGSIFQAFHDDALTDDDEVVLLHGEADTGYRPASEPLVDIRATLARASAEGIIDDSAAAILTELAKGMFFADRSYPALIAAAANLLEAEALGRLRAWLPSGRVSQKQEDARALLRRMREDNAAGEQSTELGFWFEHTTLFDELLRDRRRDPSTSLSPPPPHPSHEHGPELLSDAVMGWVLALDESRRQRYALDEERLLEAVTELRLELGLLTADAVDQWMAEQQLDRASFLRLVAADARVRWVRAVLADEVNAATPDYLRARGSQPTGSPVTGS